MTKRVITNGAVTSLGRCIAARPSARRWPTPLPARARWIPRPVSLLRGETALRTSTASRSPVLHDFQRAVSTPVNGATQTFGGTITSASGGTMKGTFTLGSPRWKAAWAIPMLPSLWPIRPMFTPAKVSGTPTAGGSWGMVSANPQLDGQRRRARLGFGLPYTDSATFGNVLTTGTATVTLNGDNPSLKAITFNNRCGASYTIAQGIRRHAQAQ